MNALGLAKFRLRFFSAFGSNGAGATRFGLVHLSADKGLTWHLPDGTLVSNSNPADGITTHISGAQALVAAANPIQILDPLSYNEMSVASSPNAQEYALDESLRVRDLIVRPIFYDSAATPGPFICMRVEVLAQGLALVVGGGGAPSGPQSIEFNGDSLSTPTANQIIGVHLVDTALTLPVNMNGGLASTEAAPTATTVVQITKNGASVGSITFPPCLHRRHILAERDKLRAWRQAESGHARGHQWLGPRLLRLARDRVLMRRRSGGANPIKSRTPWLPYEADPLSLPWRPVAALVHDVGHRLVNDLTDPMILPNGELNVAGSRHNLAYAYVGGLSDLGPEDTSNGDYDCGCRLEGRAWWPAQNLPRGVGASSQTEWGATGWGVHCGTAVLCRFMKDIGITVVAPEPLDTSTSSAQFLYASAYYDGALLVEDGPKVMFQVDCASLHGSNAATAAAAFASVITKTAQWSVSGNIPISFYDPTLLSGIPSF
ncbi:hypothetical protein [Defluviicoccus vanus]|nr:hypothetical protein [Defluviicoccus vanus]